MTEIWKDIKGFEGLYQVSNYGRVKSLKRKVIYKWKNTKSFLSVIERIMKLQNHRKGYEEVILHKKRKVYKFKVHRLVAEAFIVNPKNKSQINHIDGNKSNNNINNLEWVTQSENMKHAFKIGLKNTEHLKGENHYRSCLTEKQVLKIRALKGKKSQKEIARIYNVTPSNIWCILSKRSWKHI